MTVRDQDYPQVARRGGPRFGWFLVALAAAALKAEAVAKLVVHPYTLVGVLSAGVVASVLRARPAGLAITTAPLIALLVAPASIWLGVALGVGAYVLLMSLFVAIGTVLQAHQDPHRQQPPR